MLPDEIPIKFTLRPKQLLVTPIAVLLVFWFFHLPWGEESAPAWVQAIGSIAAIFAAWMIPFLHEQARIKRESAELFESAGWLAFRVSNSLEHMADVIRCAEIEANPAAVVDRWRFLGQRNGWLLDVKAADDFPIGKFTGSDISYLLGIRGAAAFGLECAEVLDRWDFEQARAQGKEFPLRDRMVFHKSQIDWVLSNTLNRKK